MDGQALLRAYYERGQERERLSSAKGQLEFQRTAEIIARRLPAPPALVADIGGGPGRYALWLASLGYQVEHRDLMELHVAQLTADMAGAPGIRTAVGDAREVDLPDGCVAAALLLGPLYHLPERADRLRALRECARILAPGGVAFAAAITRWAFRIDGVLAQRIYRKYPEAAELVAEGERTGAHPVLGEGAFTAYCHAPAELRAELAEAGLRDVEVVSVEGPGYLLADLEERLADPADWEVVLSTARALEGVPDLAGLGPHLIASGVRP